MATDLHTAAKLALEALKQIDEAMPFPVAKLAQAALREALAEQPAQQCWKCGDMDAAFQAKCDVPACGMKEQP
jgi:hypothetical protein